MKLCKICASTTGKRSKATNKVFNLDACSDCHKFYKAADKTVINEERKARKRKRFVVLLANGSGRVHGVNSNVVPTLVRAKALQRRLINHKFENSKYIIAEVVPIT